MGVENYNAERLLPSIGHDVYHIAQHDWKRGNKKDKEESRNNKHKRKHMVERIHPLSG